MSSAKALFPSPVIAILGATSTDRRFTAQLTFTYDLNLPDSLLNRGGVWHPARLNYEFCLLLSARLVLIARHYQRTNIAIFVPQSTDRRGLLGLLIVSTDCRSASTVEHSSPLRKIDTLFEPSIASILLDDLHLSCKAYYNGRAPLLIWNT
jgi:hypothetical protein